ncbi:MAG: hypothetical protein NZ807_04980, partial [Dehalococcoidia bacterium]|nr:hypothetical protein [Dehalococcoidia bacterium]
LYTLYLSHLSTLPNDLVLMGDFNLHVDIASSDTNQFTDILASFDLDQRVDFATHTHGHSLDLMIFSTGLDVIAVSVSDRISDHFLVLGDLNITVRSARAPSTKIRYRNIKAIDVDAFKNDIRNSDIQPTWQRNMTTPFDLLSIVMPHYLLKQSPQSLPTPG